MTSKNITILGRSYTVSHSDKKFIKPNVIIISDTVVVFTSETVPLKHNEVLLNWLKRNSKKYFFERVSQIAGLYNFEFNKISIRDQSTRWGSCSSHKNLNFNWRLYLAPKEVMDYVIIHELAHTRQMNHSKLFWNIVEEIMPEYKSYRHWLKENGKILIRMI